MAHPMFRGGLKKPLRNYLASFLTPCDYAPKNYSQNSETSKRVRRVEKSRLHLTSCYQNR